MPVVDKSVKHAAELQLIHAQTEHYRVDTAMKQHDLAHKEANDKDRIYHFPSVIIPETIDTCIEVLQHWLSLGADQITIAFNSPGGLVFDGFALYDFVADHVEQGAAIDITGYGKVASMASVCMQAGRIRSLHRNSFFMVHEVDSFLKGTMQSLKDQIEFTNSLQTRIEEVLVSRANPDLVTQASLHERTKHTDWWMTPEEALEYGFIDRIAK